MKVDDLSKQMAILPQSQPGRSEKADHAAEAQADATAKQKAKDKVQLSGLSPVIVDQRDRDVSRAQRVEALKASVASGEYKVPARAVAEKMLTKFAGAGTRH